MIKKIFVILFISILVYSCGKKGDPVYNEKNQKSKALSIKHTSIA